MDKQNVTLSLPKALLKKAKVMAAQKDKSLSELFVQAIEKMARKDKRYNTARERQLCLLKTGLNLGTKGRLAASRKEIHARG
jgi:hypothetical protein